MSGSSKRLRVLFMVDNAGVLGGAERFVAGLAMNLPRDRIEPWVCSTRQGDPHAIAALTEAGVPHLNLGRSNRLEIHRLRQLVALVRRMRFDVLHAHKFGSNVWGTLIGRLCDVPVVLAHEHNWSYSSNPLRKSLDRQLIGRLATRFIAVSEANRERMISLEGVPAEKVMVLPTAYIPQQSQSNGDIRSQLGLEPAVPLIGVAAGLRAEKALDVMLDAHARVLAVIDRAQLVIAGEGPCRSGLERQSELLGISRSVHLLGLRRDVDSILRAVDVGAMSSDWEGMPLFVFECMAANTPLVATAVGGLPEVVEQGMTGLLVPPRDPEALAQALTTVLTDRQLAARMATAASARLADFAINAVAERFAGVYEQLVAEAEQA